MVIKLELDVHRTAYALSDRHHHYNVFKQRVKSIFISRHSPLLECWTLCAIPVDLPQTANVPALQMIVSNGVCRSLSMSVLC